MFFANDTDVSVVPNVARRGQVSPVSVPSSPGSPVAILPAPLVRVNVLCGSTLSVNSFYTVREIYLLVRVCLAGVLKQ
jgi:hypothetical protein